MPLFNMTGGFAIKQGERYEIQVLYPADLRGATLRGQIRRSYGGQVLGEFQFGAIAYNGTNNKSTIPVFLTAAQTSAIPYSETNTDLWVYDIEAQVGEADPVTVLDGEVFVKPEVTV